MILTMTRIHFIFIISLSITYNISNSQIPENNLPLNYVAYKTSEPLVIDGKLNEEDWQNATWTEDFADIEGYHKPKPLHRTRAKILWDDDYLYIGAELEEPHIWATYTEDETVIFHENNFEVFIDPNGDTHNYYELEINALGTKWDLMLVKLSATEGHPLIRGKLPD